MNTYEELKAHFEKGGVLKENITGLGLTVTEIADREPNLVSFFDDEVFFYFTTAGDVKHVFPVRQGLAGHFIEAVRDAA